MKKYMKIFAISIFCLVLALCLIGCQSDADIDAEEEEGEETQETPETFKTKEDVIRSLTNYSFKYKLSYNDGDKITVTNFTDMQTADAWLYVIEDSGFLADIAEDSLYMLNMEDNTAILTDLDEEMDSFSGWGGVLFGWYDQASSFNKTGTAAVVGRSCNVYEYTFGTLRYVYYIDQVYDICLKYEISESSISESTVFMFTEFAIGNIKTSEILSILEDYTVDDYRDII